MATVRILVRFIILVVVLSTAATDRKRLLMHSQDDLYAVIANLQTEMAELKTKVKTLEAAQLTNSGSDVYIRWGRTTCPTNGTEFVYKGYMAGAHYTDDGGGSNSLCLPENPTWDHYVDGYNSGATIYGTETEIASSVSSALFGKQTDNQDIPCAVCKTQATSVMIPARSNCYPGWNLEYSGYMIAAHPTWKGKSDYVCLDAGFEFVAHGGANDNAHVVRVVEVQCGQAGGIPCPPYVDGRELACVVCSK